MAHSSTNTSNSEGNINLKDTVYTAGVTNPPANRNRRVSFLNADDSTRGTLTSVLDTNGKASIYVHAQNLANSAYFGVQATTDNKQALLVSGGISACLSQLGLPSTTWTEVALPSSTGTVTAPGNGYYVLCKRGTATGQYAVMENQTSRFRTCDTSSGNGTETWVYAPAKKGEKVYIEYSLAGETVSFRFHYTSGDAEAASISGGGVAPTIIVDQAFSPTSTNAQSGTAVAQAVSTKQDTLLTGNNISIVNNQISSTDLFKNIITTSTTIALNNSNSLFKISVSANITITFNTSSATFSNRCYTFELWVVTNAARTITWPSTVKWENSTTPSIDKAGNWFFVFRTLDNGSNWIASCQGWWAA